MFRTWREFLDAQSGKRYLHAGAGKRGTTRRRSKRSPLTVEELEIRQAPAIVYAIENGNYGQQGTGNPNPYRIARIDTTTGQESTLWENSNGSYFGGDLTALPNGNLVFAYYNSGANEIWQIDPTATNPKPTLYATFPPDSAQTVNPVTTSVDDLAVGPDGTLFVTYVGQPPVYSDSGQPLSPNFPGEILSWNPVNKQVTTVWQGATDTEDGPGPNSTGLAVEPNGAVVFAGMVGGQAGIYEIDPTAQNPTPTLLAADPTPTSEAQADDAQYQAQLSNYDQPVNGNPSPNIIITEGSPDTYSVISDLAIGVQGTIYASVSSSYTYLQVYGAGGSAIIFQESWYVPGALVQINPTTGQEATIWQGDGGTLDGPGGAGGWNGGPSDPGGAFYATYDDGSGLAVEPEPDGNVVFAGSMGDHFGLFSFNPNSAANPTQTLALNPDPTQTTPASYDIFSLAVPLPGFSPAQIRNVYGINSLPASDDGSGQTIAILAIDDAPTLATDVNAFDQQFGTTFFGPTLYDQYGAASSFLTVLNEDGEAGLPAPSSPTTAFAGEELLDVEWAHAMAPGAHIDVIECASGSFADLLAGAQTAANLPGVSVVSISYGSNEGTGVSQAQEAAYDHAFTTPAGHEGVTFLAASGDSGINDASYPAFSPNVVAVGGTSLYLNEDSSYSAEFGWSFGGNGDPSDDASGGGPSLFEPEPAYQLGVQTTGYRTIPDVAFVADGSEGSNLTNGTDGNTGAAVCNSYNNINSAGVLEAPWSAIRGTSLATPCWAGLIAIANQGRISNGLTTLNSPNNPRQTLTALYSLPAGDFHNNLGGYNGAPNAGLINSARYDEITGLGSPVANLLIPDLIAFNSNNAPDVNVDPVNIAYGTPLEDWQLSGTATFNGQPVPGVFTYTSAAGQVLPAGDGQSEDVTFTPDDDIDYTAVATTVTVNVAQASQSIQFNVPGAASNGTTIALSAIGGGSGNSVTFALISGPATLNGNMLSFTGVGSVVVEADQAGDANDAAAAPVQRTIVVNTASQAVSENENGTPAAVTVSSLLGSAYSDPDGASKPGIAIFQTMGSGTWQYSTNGTTWTAIGSVSPTQALLLPAADSLRFVPALNWSGQANLDFAAWDGSQGKAGSDANISTSGGTTAFSINAGTLAITVNPAPFWVGTGAALPPLLPDTTPAGQTIASVFGSYFEDNNPAATSVGVAIESAGTLAGDTWQFQISGSTTWTNFPAVSATSALLLSGSDEIRFVSKNSTVGALSLKALAWDGSIGTDGKTANPTGSAFSSTTLTATESVSRAPTLGTASINQWSVVQYATSAAATVASLLTKAGYADAGLPAGMAVIGTVTTLGTYQYMLAGGSWQPLPSVSPSSALLLPSTASLRFVAGNQTGAATLTFEGWDQTQGAAGQTYDITSTGGASAFSNASTVLSSTVTASTSQAPILSKSSFAESAVAVNTTAAITVSTLLSQVGYADHDGSPGIALIGAFAAGGSVQYLLAGGTWQPLPSVSPSSALLLPSTASLRLTASSQLGTATLTFDGWDQTQGSAGHLFDIAITGGASAFSAASATVSIPIGQAPSWSAATGAALTALPPGAYSTVNNSSPAGNTIASVFGSFFQDITPSLPVGVAITAVAGNGAWQFSLTNGASWLNFAPTLSKTSALLLSANDLIRFVPKTTAADAGTLTAYAWDGSTGTLGAVVNLNQLGTGGATAFSATTLVAKSSFNTAPTLSTLSPSLNAVNENVNSPAVTAATLLSKAGYADPDGKPVPSGIAITGDTGPGVWQWLNGATWTALPSVSSSLAFLLPSAAQLRFQPANNLAANTNGSATLTYVAWDETAGAADKTFALTSQGGASAFSAASATASMPINFVKQAPTWLSGTSANFTPVLGLSTSNPTPNPAGDTVAAVFGNAYHDAAGAPVGVAISAQNGTSVGVWQYSTNNGTTWQAFPANLSTGAPLLLSANDMIRFVPSEAFSGAVSLKVYAWDGATLSAAALTATCLINSAPTLT
jgi:hypothetical protein